jgi:cation:H+ antiporter
MMVFVTLVFYFLSLDFFLSFWEGVFLLTGMITFNAYLFRNLGKPLSKAQENIEEEFNDVKTYSWIISIGFLIVGIIGLYFGSELLVTNAVLISREFGISERVIGVTIVAIGTSLPELITSIIAALSKRTDLALGNILGSNIMNILSIIGITAIINPIQISQPFIDSDYLWMIGISLLLFPLMKAKMRIAKPEGIILLLSYFAYLYFLL